MVWVWETVRLEAAGMQVAELRAACLRLRGCEAASCKGAQHAAHFENIALSYFIVRHLEPIPQASTLYEARNLTCADESVDLFVPLLNHPVALK